MHSYLREYVLKDLPKREISREMVLGDLEEDEQRIWILTDARNPLGPWQDAAVVDHWKGEIVSTGLSDRTNEMLQ